MTQDKANEASLLYLRSHHVMTLATNGPHGIWAAALFYVSRGFNLFFLSAGHTRHAQNMVVNARVAATIQENYTEWHQIKGIQLEGLVQQLHGQEKQSAIADYQKRFPFTSEADKQIQAALTKVNWYQLTPDRFYFIDNSQGLGHRSEIKIL